MGFLDDLEHLIEHELSENIRILELCENIWILGLCENIRILDVFTKLGFWPFFVLKVALKVNYDLEFEIYGHCSLC